MWTKKGERRANSFTAAPPAKLWIGNVALMATGKAEILLPRIYEAVELVVRQFLGKPVALVLAEVELLGGRIEIHADDLPDAAGDNFCATAVQVNPANLRMPFRGHANVTRSAHLKVELVVGPDGQIFPAMGLIARQIIIDDDGFRRVVEIVLDLFDLRDLVKLGDVQRAVSERYAVRTEQPREQRLHLALPIFLGDRVDLIKEAGADKDGSLVAAGKRTRIDHSTGVNFKLEAVGCFQLRDWDLVGRCSDRWRGYRCELLR